MNTETPVVSATQLRKFYPTRGRQKGGVLAVESINFELRQGDCLGIVGESGSGKTTIAKMLLGIEIPTAGTITVVGRDRSIPARGSSERRKRGRELQMVCQDPYVSLDPRQTGWSCLREVIQLHFPDQTRSQVESRILELGSQVGLSTEQLRVRPNSLSGGQRQRVAIARALASEPQAIILDEAVSGLDVSIQAQILNLLMDIKRETGVAYLFISHDLAVIRQMAGYVIVMESGRVVEEGETARVLDQPKEKYTRMLRESVPGPGWSPKRRNLA